MNRIKAKYDHFLFFWKATEGNTEGNTEGTEGNTGQGGGSRGVVEKRRTGEQTVGQEHIPDGPEKRMLEGDMGHKLSPLRPTDDYGK